MPGTTVWYSYLITNPGNVMVRNISLVAPTVGPWVCNGTTPGSTQGMPLANMPVYQAVLCR
jgi:hypothetical protein